MEKETTTLRLPTELKETLQAEADRKGYSLNELMMFIFNDYVKTHYLEE